MSSQNWWVLPDAPLWLGMFVGGFVIQFLVAGGYRRATQGTWSAAIASMFTVQGINGCGAAPGPLPFVAVVNSAVSALLIGLVFAIRSGRAAKRGELNQAPCLATAAQARQDSTPPRAEERVRGE